MTDAFGHGVPATVALVNGRILLQIRDARARYPLRIDPTINESGGADLTESSDNTDGFGTALAMSADGHTLVVGAPSTGNGAAYLFTEPATGGWQNATPIAELTASDGASGDRFGQSVAVSDDGSTIVVGAPFHGSWKGAVYVFTEPQSGGWQNATETAELTPNLTTNGGNNDTGFGDSVAVSGDGGTVAVGAAGPAKETEAPTRTKGPCMSSPSRRAAAGRSLDADRGVDG